MESVATDEVASEALRLGNAVHVGVHAVADEMETRLGIRRTNELTAVLDAFRLALLSGGG